MAWTSLPFCLLDNSSYSTPGALLIASGPAPSEEAEVELCQEGPASYWGRQKLSAIPNAELQYAINEFQLYKCPVWPCIVYLLPSREQQTDPRE